MKHILKRIADLAIASTALLLLAPIMLLIALLCWSVQGRPLLFRQVRVGRGGVLFTLPKFRSMRDASDANGEPLPDEMRTSWLGRILRRFRLDELPGFLPVLSGRMSLVGPRPLPPYVLNGLAGSAERSRVRPGFTGLAQVSGNTLLSNEEKLALDIHYIRNWDLAMDVGIVLRTVETIVRGERRNEQLILEALDALQSDNPAGPGGRSRAAVE